MTVLRAQVLDAGSPVQGRTVTLEPYTGNPYRRPGPPRAPATSDASGWVSWTLPDPTRRPGPKGLAWVLRGLEAQPVVARTDPAEGTVTLDAAHRLGTLDAQGGLVAAPAPVAPSVSQEISQAADTDPEREQFIPARLSDAALRAFFERRRHTLRSTFETRYRADQPPVMAAPPTITFTAATGATTITGGIAVPILLAPNGAALDPRFAHRGAPLSNRASSGFQGTVAQAKSGTGGGGTALTSGGYPHSLEFVYDGAVFEFIAFADGGPWNYRLWVDGVPKAARSENQAGSNGNDNRVKVDFGTRANRRIRIDFARTVGPIKVWTGPQDTITPAPPRWGNLLIIGDSFADAANGINSLDVYSMSLVTLLGAGDYYIDGQGGSGFTVTGGTGKAVYLDRINLVPDTWTPDLILLQGSTNDGASSSATVTAAVQAAIARCRVRWPDAVLALSGLMLPNASSAFTAGNVTNNSSLIALASSVDILIDPVAKGWFSGTGNAGAVTGTGNADIYRSNDTVHPTQAGHDYLASRTARDLLAGLAVLAP